MKYYEQLVERMTTYYRNQTGFTPDQASEVMLRIRILAAQLDPRLHRLDDAEGAVHMAQHHHILYRDIPQRLRPGGLQHRPLGVNAGFYRGLLLAQSGVGKVKVLPTHRGSGTVDAGHLQLQVDRRRHRLAHHRVNAQVPLLPQQLL